MTLLTFARRVLSAARRFVFMATLKTLQVIHQKRAHRSSGKRFSFRPLEWGEGVSIVIPERAGGEMLAQCLESVRVAGEKLSSPFEVIVVINGTPLSHYEPLIKKYKKEVRFFHSKVPLSFSHAVLKGIRHASFGAIYLLNNDMVIDPDALESLIPWRAPHVFSIASQIFFKDRNRRREETGWTDMRITESGIEIFDVVPEDSTTVRGTLYAGGGASLFNRNLLLRLISPSDPYGPFYWEDVEWGIRAWRMGYDSLFCPVSKVVHRHRATVSKFYGEEEINRVFQRNSIQFLLRNDFDRFSLKIIMERINASDPLTRMELTRFRNSFFLLVDALKSYLTGRFPFSVMYHRRKFYLKPFSGKAHEKSMIMVSPYAVFPPSHGGAIRMAHLIEEISRTHNVILLSDEENIYQATDIPLFDKCHAIHLTGGRYEPPADRGKRIHRIRNHCHDGLKNELARLLVTLKPSVVQIEYIELGALIDLKKDHAPWIIDLHDVLISEDKGNLSDADRYELGLIRRYDRAIVCSSEDAALIEHKRIEIIPNGARYMDRPYTPSFNHSTLLFAGPFRYPPNVIGIDIFLTTVFPRLKAQIPDLKVNILGGNGANKVADQMPCFNQPGVFVHEFVSDVYPFFDQATVTINPQYQTRGSSLKLIESLALGRVCVSTLDGARGVLAEGFKSLIAVERIEDFFEPLGHLLRDDSYRISLEAPEKLKLDQYTWPHAGKLIRNLYSSCQGNP